jgi:hypothetical protein
LLAILGGNHDEPDDEPETLLFRRTAEGTGHLAPGAFIPGAFAPAASGLRGKKNAGEGSAEPVLTAGVFAQEHEQKMYQEVIDRFQEQNQVTVNFGAWNDYLGPTIFIRNQVWEPVTVLIWTCSKTKVFEQVY